MNIHSKLLLPSQTPKVWFDISVSLKTTCEYIFSIPVILRHKQPVGRVDVTFWSINWELDRRLRVIPLPCIQPVCTSDETLLLSSKHVTLINRTMLYQAMLSNASCDVENSIKKLLFVPFFQTAFIKLTMEIILIFGHSEGDTFSLNVPNLGYY